MNQGVGLSGDLARRAMGSTWHLDPETGELREHLGPGRPPLHFAEVYASLGQAIAAHPSARPVPLAERMRLPRRSPLALAAARDLENASTSAWLVLADDVLANGVRVEKVKITEVEYMAAPVWLSGIADWVAHSAVLSGQHVYRIRIGHDAHGYPVPTETPERRMGWGWTQVRDAVAFLDRTSAESHADALSDRLLDAADWRSRSAA